MRPRLVMAAPITDRELRKLEQLCDVTYYPTGQYDSHDGITDEFIINKYSGYEIVVLYSEPVNRNCIQALAESGVKLIVCPRSNPVNVDKEACQEFGIVLCYAPGRNANCVAEFAFGIILGLVKNIVICNRKLMSGEFAGPARENILDVPDVKDVYWHTEDGTMPEDVLPESFDLKGKTLGLAGFGAIARRVAEIAHGFGMEVEAYDPYCPADAMTAAGVRPVNLDGLLADSDILSLHMAVTPETTGSVNKEWFKKMKKSAYLVNTARAALVDQKDFIEAVEREEIAGAALDVCWEEAIPVNHPLLSHDNVLITTHHAGSSRDVMQWQSAMILEIIEDYCEGKPVRYQKK